MSVGVELTHNACLGAVRGWRTQWQRDLLDRAIVVHDEDERAFLCRRQLAVGSQLRREVQINAPAALPRAIDGGNHVIELLYGRQRRIGVAAGAQQHRIGTETESSHQGDEQRRLVLAVTIARFEHLGGQPRQIAANAEGQRDVPKILRHPAMYGPQRILQRVRVLHMFGELGFEGRVQRVTARRKLGIPAGELAPCDR